jgi:hypothetical protein
MDVGGAIAITPDGEILRYDWDKEEVRVCHNEFRTIALVQAAKNFPELRQLMPPRPATAINCPECDGTGTVLGSLICGRCLGQGLA